MQKIIWPTISAQVVNLRLDTNNVRLDILGLSQGAIINDLFSGDKTFTLVKEILSSGLYNNDLPIVASEGGVLVVLEGNRRIAALKAILEPRIVPAFESRIVKLIDNGDVSVFEEIEVKLCESREEAARLISTIHTTQGRRPWPPLRQAYFYFAQIENGERSILDLVSDFPNVDIPKFVKMWEWHRLITSINYEDDSVQREVTSRSFNITSLERFYDNENFRDRFNVRIDRYGRTTFQSEHLDRVIACLKILISDIVSGRVTSRTMNNDSQIREYLDKLSSITPLTGALSTPRPDETHQVRATETSLSAEPHTSIQDGS